MKQKTLCTLTLSSLRAPAGTSATGGRLLSLAPVFACADGPELGGLLARESNSGLRTQLADKLQRNGSVGHNDGESIYTLGMKFSF